MAALSSLSLLLGLPVPVIAPGSVEKRLGASELRMATTAFHRIRGYADRIEFPRFRDTVLQEAFLAMPPLVMQRVFAAWNYTASGALSLKEFLIGITIAWKGTRDEQLRFVFQLMDRHGRQEVSKKDTTALLQAMAREDAVVAIEMDGVTPWTVDMFVDMLFPSHELSLTPSRFLKAMTGKKYDWFALLDWFPVLAAPYQHEFERLRVKTPVMATPRGLWSTMRRIGSTDSITSATSTATWSASSPHAHTLNYSSVGPEPTLIHVEVMDGDRFQALKSAMLDLLDWFHATNEPLTDDDIMERLQGLASEHVLVAAQRTQQYCHGDFISKPGIDINDVDQGTDHTKTAINSTRTRLVWWIFSLCCGYSRSSSEVLRYIFVLFDNECRGYWQTPQLTRFLTWTALTDHAVKLNDDVERRSHVLMEELAQHSEMTFQNNVISAPTQSNSLPGSPNQQTGMNKSDQCWRFREFERFTQRDHLAGCSSADIDIIFTAFHIQLMRSRKETLSHRMRMEALHTFCEVLITSQEFSPPDDGICLIQKSMWSRMVEWVCDYDSNQRLAGMLMRQVGTEIPVPSRGEAIAIPATSVMVLPLSLWLLISTWGKDMDSTVATSEHQPAKKQEVGNWMQEVTRVKLPGAAEQVLPLSASGTRISFRGLLASVSMVFAARDGTEYRVGLRHVVLDERLSLQDLVEAILIRRHLQKDGNGSGESSLFCSGLVRLSVVGATPPPLIEVSRGLVLAPLHSFLELDELRRADIELNVVEAEGRCDSVSGINKAMSFARTGERPDLAPIQVAQTPRRRGCAREMTSVGWNKVHGLANLGNTCFMNSALQCLAMTPVLREYFLRQEHLFDINARRVEREGQATTRRFRRKAVDSKPEMVLPTSSLLPLAFGQLLKDMNAFSSNGAVAGVRDVVSPNEMKNAVGALFPHLGDGTQQDAQEFLMTLLSHLSDELRRVPIVPGTDQTQVVDASTAPSPSSFVSPSILSRFSTLTRRSTDSKGSSSQWDVAATDSTLTTRFETRDSNGRPDTIVAQEWWLAHLIREPSIITALFCGQFKSVLKCTQCGATSTRFEPFSSLQLPLIDETTMHSPRQTVSHVDVVVVLHFAESPCGKPSRRLVVTAGINWTVKQLLIQIQTNHTRSLPIDGSQSYGYIAVQLNGFQVGEYIDHDALVSSLPLPLDVFELEYVKCPIKCGSTCRETENVLFRELSIQRLHDTVRSTSTSPLESLLSSPTSRMSVQNVSSPKPTLNVNDDTSKVDGESLSRETSELLVCRNQTILIRFLHRRPGLVPFYSMSPYRQVLFGFPFVYCVPVSVVSGRHLYHLIHRRFTASNAVEGQVEARSRRMFVLRRVKRDGTSCANCHWSSRCPGCEVDRSEEAPLALELDETIAIDWEFDHDRPHDDPLEDWISCGVRVEDDPSYLTYRESTAHSLYKSMEMLCSEEGLDARCAHCEEAASVPDEVTLPPVSGNDTAIIKKNASGSDCGDENDRWAEARHRKANELPALGAQKRAGKHEGMLLPHTKSLSLWSLPAILVVQLKRFELVTDGGYSYQRLNHSVEFPVTNLDLSKFVVSADEGTATSPGSGASEVQSDADVNRAVRYLASQLNFPTGTASRARTRYRLYGVVHHIGDLGSGHYTAHIRHPDTKDWWLVDDASATRANPDHISPSSSAYLLFYVREDVDTGSEDEDDDADDLLLPPSIPAASPVFTPRSKQAMSFFPRQQGAQRVSEAAVRVLFKQELSQSTHKKSGRSDDSSCVVM